MSAATPTAAAPLSMGPAEWALLLVLSTLWGGSFFFVEVALAGGVPPLSVVLARVALAAAALGVALRLLGHAPPRGGPAWRALLGQGLLNNLVPFALIAWGQTRIGGGLASILVAATPVFSMLAAHALTSDERMGGAKLAGAAVGIAGVALVAGPAALAAAGGGGAGAPPLLAVLACLGGGLSYAVAGVYGRRLKALGVGAPQAAFGQALASALLLVPAVALLERPWELPAPGAPALGALAALGLLSSALAYAIFFRVLAAGGVTNASLVTLLMPATAILLGAAVLGERTEPHHWAGFAVIALAVLLIDGRPLRWATRRLGRPAPERT